MALLGEITWFRGDSYPIELTIKDKATSEAIDISGYAFLMTVNTEKDPIDETAQIFQVVGEIDADQITNKGKITLTPTAVNTDLSNGTYYYDVQMTDSSGNIRTIAKDKFKISQDITKQ